MCLWGNKGIFPGAGKVIWRDWYTHDTVNASVGSNTTLDAPLGHINVHIRSGAALLLHPTPGYTTTETRASPLGLLISLDKDGHADGSAYLDDGESVPPTPNTTLTISARKGEVVVRPSGDYEIAQVLEKVVVLGAASERPSFVSINGLVVKQWDFDVSLQRLVISGIEVGLHQSPVVITWH